MNHPHEKYCKKVLEMYSSLQKSVDKAGGCIIDIERLREMTAEDLILHLASNDVRFCYIGEEQEDDSYAGVHNTQR